MNSLGLFKAQNGLDEGYIKKVNDLQEAKELAQLQEFFLDVINIPFSHTPIGKNDAIYLQHRNTSRRTKNNHCDKANKHMFRGTCHQPHVNGFSIHAYNFASYLVQNSEHFKPLQKQALEQVIFF